MLINLELEEIMSNTLSLKDFERCIMISVPTQLYNVIEDWVKKQNLVVKCVRTSSSNTHKTFYIDDKDGTVSKPK